MHNVLHTIKIVGSIKCTLCSKLEVFGKPVIILIEKLYRAMVSFHLYSLTGCACLSQVSQ